MRQREAVDQICSELLGSAEILRWEAWWKGRSRDMLEGRRRGGAPAHASGSGNARCTLC